MGVRLNRPQEKHWFPRKLRRDLYERLFDDFERGSLTVARS